MHFSAPNFPSAPREPVRAKFPSERACACVCRRGGWRRVLAWLVGRLRGAAPVEGGPRDHPSRVSLPRESLAAGVRARRSMHAALEAGDTFRARGGQGGGGAALIKAQGGQRSGLDSVCQPVTVSRGRLGASSKRDPLKVCLGYTGRDSLTRSINQTSTLSSTPRKQPATHKQEQWLSLLRRTANSSLSRNRTALR